MRGVLGKQLIVVRASINIRDIIITNKKVVPTKLGREEFARGMVQGLKQRLVVMMDVQTLFRRKEFA